MPVFMAFPPFLSATLAVLAALVAGLTFTRARRHNVSEPYDCEREIARLTQKVRHPWKHRAAQAKRWFHD